MRCRSLWFAGLAAAVLLVAGSPPSVEAADAWSPILEVELGYGRSAGAESLWIEEYVGSPPGDSLLIVGLVTGLHGPLAYLEAVPGSHEYTIVLRDMIGRGFRPFDDYGGDPNSGGLCREYQSGLLLLLDDASPDATPASVATYEDGSVLLYGVADETELLAGANVSAYYIRDVDMWGHFAGGELFYAVNLNGEGLPLRLRGTYRDESTYHGLGVAALGYFATFTFTIEAYLPVPVRSTTWGRLKTLYTTQAP